MSAGMFGPEVRTPEVETPGDTLPASTKDYIGEVDEVQFSLRHWGQSRDTFVQCNKCGCLVGDLDIHRTVTCAAIVTGPAPTLGQ